jgi:dihydrofolate reductase
MRVLLLAALTADGKIARHADELTTWTSRADKRLFARTSREAGVVIMGRRTFDTLPEPLPGRLHVVLTHQPQESTTDQVEYCHDAPTDIVERLASRGYASAVLAGGAQTFRAFLAANLVDELWLTVEPIVFGHGLTLLGDEPQHQRLRLLESRSLGNDAVLLRYAPPPDQ